jgi:hypothetical protein
MPRALSRAALVAAIFAAGCAVGRSVEGPRAASAEAPAADRVFELRTYTSPDGKLPVLETRFRDHTRRIFEKHGMTNIGYWKPMDGPEANNTLIYLIAHDSREAAQASWAAFRADPEWRQVAAASEADGRIVSGVESVFLTPTDYSPIR